MNIKFSYFNKITLLIVISVIATASLLFVPAIPQDPTYHQFADQRTLLGIPHCLNVVSNLLFLIVGGLGTKLLVSDNNQNILKEVYPAYLLFFTGIFATGMGSSYYHLSPSNQTLIWDRLPMTIAFMAFFTIILSEFVSVKAGKQIFLPSLIFGIFSVWYWDYTEQLGRGDLRLYGLVQFLPILLIFLFLTLFSSRLTYSRYYWYLLGFYLLAKIFEVADHPIYEWVTFISGHSIKHLLAALGCYFIYVQLKQRRVGDKQE